MELWSRCVRHLEQELSAEDFNTWIRPLQAEESEGALKILAPNAYVCDKVSSHYQALINGYVSDLVPNNPPSLRFEVGSLRQSSGPNRALRPSDGREPRIEQRDPPLPRIASNLNPALTFDTFVEGKSNQIARAASMQVASNPGKAYNPLFIYGGVGLGKTHLMHAVGNQILTDNPKARIVYLHSERFVREMVKALQHNTIDEFKRKYRSVNGLLIDDIQFFVGKERSQEEFFHTFNELFESQQQIILSSDRFPKEVQGLEERLKSRFGWGLTVEIGPPDLETRVAIIQNKASQAGMQLSDDVAFFIGKRIRSNIREIEGALKQVIANAQFTGRPITIEYTKEWLRAMLSAQDKLVTIENIQKTVAEYFKIRLSDLTSANRSRSVARPRQIAMSLAKELTNHSLPEIGKEFGGRDHSTVLHATRKVKALRDSDTKLAEDYANLLRTLTN